MEARASVLPLSRWTQLVSGSPSSVLVMRAAIGGVTGIVLVAPPIAALITSTLEGDPDTSCVHLLKGRTLARASIYSAWARLCRQKQIVGLTPHDLRRTTANQVLNATGDLRDVQAYLGHENLRSTAHYIVPFGDRRVRELQQLLKFHSEVKQ